VDELLRVQLAAAGGRKVRLRWLAERSINLLLARQPA
jgi:hypothetical protein